MNGYTDEFRGNRVSSALFEVPLSRQAIPTLMPQ